MQKKKWTGTSCTFYWHVMYFLLARHVLLLARHVLFGNLFKPQTPWLSHLKFPKYYKVFINKKKYKAHARASVLFLNIQNKNNKPKDKKVNF